MTFQVVSKSCCLFDLHFFLYSKFTNYFLLEVLMTALGDESVYLPVRRKREPWTGALQTPALSAAYFIAAIVSFLLGSSFIGISFLTACLYANPHIVLSFQQRYASSLRRLRLNPVMVTGCLIGVAGGVALALAVAEPAHAQFFNKAEDFLKKLAGNSGGAQTAAIITLVMDTIRALFVIYMIFGLVQVINAVRQGEEWKDLAKTPFLILMIGVLGDVLVGAIAG